VTGARARTGWSIRQLPSGRWQAVIRDPAAPQRRISLGTHPTAETAEHAAQAALVDRRRGQWHDPAHGAITLGDYLDRWLQAKAATGAHGVRYRAEAERWARLNINPRIGHLTLPQLTPAAVRGWYQRLQADRIAAAGTVGLVPAKTYRLLRAALADAVRDELIARNPADIPSAGVEHSQERPLVGVDELAALVDAAPDHRKALLEVAIWGGLRLGELAALRRQDVDVLRRTVTVAWTLADTGGGMAVKRPKTRAGQRTVVLPAHAAKVLADHLGRFVGADAGAIVFVGERGGVLRRANWAREWRRIREAAGVPAGVRFHDLRHAAGTMAAQAGATERELQARLGHASPATARRYQHAAARRDADLADRLGEMAERAQRTVSARPADIDRSRRL